MDNVCNRCLFSIPSKVEMAEEQEYLNICHFMYKSFSYFEVINSLRNAIIGRC